MCTPTAAPSSLSKHVLWPHCGRPRREPSELGRSSSGEPVWTCPDQSYKSGNRHSLVVFQRLWALLRLRRQERGRSMGKLASTRSGFEASRVYTEKPELGFSINPKKQLCPQGRTFWAELCLWKGNTLTWWQLWFNPKCEPRLLFKIYNGTSKNLPSRKVYHFDKIYILY